MHICQCASALLLYTSIILYAFQASFLLLCFTPSKAYRSLIIRAFQPISSHCSVASFGIQPDLCFTHTHCPSMPPISPNVPKITIAQAASPVHVVSSDHKPPLFAPSTDSIHVPVRITVTKPSTAIYIPSINSRRIWKPACCVMTLLLRTSSTR